MEKLDIVDYLNSKEKIMGILKTTNKNHFKSPQDNNMNEKREGVVDQVRYTIYLDGE